MITHQRQLEIAFVAHHSDGLSFVALDVDQRE